MENQINNWIQGKSQLPAFGKMKQYILRSEKLKSINELLYKDGQYTKIRERCNGNTHYNFFQHVMLNDNEMYVDKRVSILNGFSKDLQDIFVLHFVYVFTINDHYMSSSDYADYLDVGETLPEDSQYWVSPFVQKAFDSLIRNYKPELAHELKNSTSMHLD